MLVWGVEASDVSSLQLTCRFPCYDSWMKVNSQRPDLLLTNAMALIESSVNVPQLPPRLYQTDPRRAVTVAAPATPAAVGVPDHRLSMPAPTCKTPRATSGNGRRHRKKELFQMLPTRARCEVDD